jgi:hypothetical protein
MVINSCKIIFFLTLISFGVYGNQDGTPKFLQDVYDNIFYAANNTNIGKPELVYDKENNSQIVTYKSGFRKGNSGSLIVGYKFIDLMRSFGKDSCNALAFVLGHEMAHIVLKTI